MQRNQLFLRSSVLRLAFIILIAVGLGSPALATNGYFSHGFGLRYKAMAGAGIAVYLSPMAAANNPGSLAFLGKQYDVTFSLFNPNRQFTVKGNPSGFPGTFGLAPGTVESGSKAFVIPSFAASWPASERLVIGVALYGNGGMNTNYDNPVFGVSPAGVDLAQLFISPTISVKVSERHGLGVTPIFAFQRFEAKGLAAFAPFSLDGRKLSNNGHSSSTGFGARIGYFGQWLDFLSVGAAFQTRISMSAFDEYTGLFAGRGDFDIPANWTAGVALGSQNFRLAFDVQQMLYSDIRAVGNPLDVTKLSPVLPDGQTPNPNFKPLGDPEGSGFGWEDMTVFKIGAYLQAGEGWTWRAGFSFGDQPIPESEVLFNILAPGVIENHLTFGFSKQFADGKEITVAVTRAFSSSVSGPNPLEVPGQQTIELKMDQWEFGLGFSF